MADAAGLTREPRRPLRLADVLAIAAPIMLSNATTPLIGVVDAAVIGQLGRAELIGGVAVAAAIFNALLWIFGFLRMGTTGFTAQAFGAGDSSEVAAALARALAVALAAGLIMIVFQRPIFQTFLWFLGGSAGVQQAAATYYGWRIWAVPAGLVNFAVLGWLIGLGRSMLAFWLQLLLNLVNIVLALVLVLGFDAGVDGVGAAALVAEIVAAIAGLSVAGREARRRRARTSAAAVLDIRRLKATFAVNRDILIRTACVVGATQVVTMQGASGGDVTLAANALLLNILYVCYYMLDGYAFAAESLVGQAVGAGDRQRLGEAVRLSTAAAAITGATLSLAIWLGGDAIIARMTPNIEIQAVARAFLGWAAIAPIMAVWCFQLDGIFIGATRSVDMRNMMLASFAVFLAAGWLLVPWLGNHGLWAALMLFYVARAVTLAARYPALAAAVAAARKVRPA